MKKMIAFTLTVFLISCGSDSKKTDSQADLGNDVNDVEIDPIDGVSSKPLSGVLDGKPWTYVQGKAQEVNGEYVIVLYEVATANPCVQEPVSPGSVAIIREGIVSSGEVSRSQNAIFAYPGATAVSTDGIWAITEVGETFISGGLNARAGDDFVDGQFEARICR